MADTAGLLKSNNQSSKSRVMAKQRFISARVHKDTATLILLNKPYGIVSQFSGDDQNLSRLIDIPNVYPAGRLDKDSEGLLLLTDHGQLQHRIANPRFKLEKSYWVQVDGSITQDAIDQLTNGVTLKDGIAKAISAREINEPPLLWPRTPPIRVRQTLPTSWVELVINEGRNRQVRRMTAAAGFPTLRLIRHRIGKWSVSNITSGNYQTIRQKFVEFRL